MKVVTVRMHPAVHKYLVDRAHELKLSMNQFCLQRLMGLPEDLWADDPLARREPSEAERELMSFLEEKVRIDREMAELKEKSLRPFAQPANGNQQTIPVKGWTNNL